MDTNWRPMQGSNPAAAGDDWRAELQPESRSRIVNNILETGTQQAPGNAQASADSTAQTDRAGAGDWQEEIYQMIKSLKRQHFVELNELFNKISLKLQQVDSVIPRQIPPEQYGRLKSFRKMLDLILQLMQISKSDIQPSMRYKVPQYEKQIIIILNAQRRKPVQFHLPAGQAPDSIISQQKQPSQSLQQHDSHTNHQASLSSMSTVLLSSSAAVFRHVPAPPTTNFSVYTQENGADIQRPAGSDLESAQGSNFSSMPYGSVAGGIQQRSTWPMQGIVNAQLQTMSTMQPDANSMQARKHTPKRSWCDAF